MQTLLTWLPDDQPPVAIDDLATVLETVPGLTVDGQPGADYRPFHWRCPATGARADGDLGLPPLAEDTKPHAEAKAYPGWQPAALSLHLPLPVPHWHGLEALQILEQAIGRFPDLAVLDTEDTGNEEDDNLGPGPLDRPRLLASWERLHASHTAGMADLPRMQRGASVGLWRYRRELAAGRDTWPDLAWPTVGAVVDDGLARAVAVLPAARGERPVAIPPVELVVVPNADGAGVLDANRLLDLPNATELSLTGSLSFAAEAVDAAIAAHPLVPVTRYRALDDDGWSD